MFQRCSPATLNEQPLRLDGLGVCVSVCVSVADWLDVQIKKCALYVDIVLGSSEVSDDSDAENVDRQIQHRTNTLMHVCWHRNTSVSMVERSTAVRVSSHYSN